MKPTTAYKRLNKLIWMGRLPPAKIVFAGDDTLPHCLGITLFDRDFAAPVIFLNSKSKRWGQTLVHEMVHVAEPDLNHGKIFDSLVTLYWRRARKQMPELGNL